MKQLLTLVGATVGRRVGLVAGARVGTMTGFMVGVVGTAAARLTAPAVADFGHSQVYLAV